MNTTEQPNAKIISMRPAEENENEMLRDLVRKQRKRIKLLEFENALLWAGTNREGTLQ